MTHFAIDWERQHGDLPPGQDQPPVERRRRATTTRSSRCVRARATAGPARCAPAARARRRRPRQLSLRPREEHAALQLARSARRPATSPRATGDGRASRAPSPRACAPAACGGHATGRCRRCAWSMWRSPSASACNGSTPGGPASPGPPPAPRASPPSRQTEPRPDFPNSISAARKVCSFFANSVLR